MFNTVLILLGVALVDEDSGPVQHTMASALVGVGLARTLNELGGD